MEITDGRLVPLGYEQITDLSSAVGLTPPSAYIDLTLIQVEAQAVRWRDDGDAPTSTVGVPLAVGVIFPYNGDPRSIQFIESSAGAILNISYYRSAARSL